MPDNYFDFSSLKTTRNRPYDADNLNYIYGRLKERGYDDKHIAVLLGTIAEESGGNPYAVSPDGKFQGLLQWAGDRYAINPFMEENPKRELDRQIDYIARTIDNLDDSKSWTHGGKGSGYNRAADAHEAYVSSDSLDAINHAFNRGYVRPTGGDDSVANRYKVAEQVYNIITSGLPESVKAVNNSDAPFARDLRAGAKQRGYIKNADGSVSSYKMASGADDIGPYVFPVIQRDENGVLRDYSMPPYKAGYAQQRAEETGNLVRVPTDEDAQWFAEDNYKRFYDVAPDINAYADGGGIHIKPENRGKFTALKERTGHSATWFKENGTPAQRKMATFELNAAKWHGDGGKLKSTAKKVANKVSQATLRAAMADNPAVMQASGWDWDKDGNVVQGDPSALGPTALRNTLAEISYMPLADIGLAAIGSVPAVTKAVSAAREYLPGVAKRTAEAVVRIGDEAEHIKSVKKQLANKNAIKYILNPKADKSLAYNLPYRYSGNSVSDAAHPGDIVDQFFGKVDVPNAIYDNNVLPDFMRAYVDRKYPNKKIPIRNLENVKMDDFHLEDLPTAEQVEKLRKGETVRFGATSGDVFSLDTNKSIVDPGGFNLLQRLDNGENLYEAWDIWKFSPDEYARRYLNKKSITTPLKRFGLKLIDNQGTPIIHHWSGKMPY